MGKIKKKLKTTSPGTHKSGNSSNNNGTKEPPVGTNPSSKIPERYFNSPQNSNSSQAKTKKKPGKNQRKKVGSNVTSSTTPPKPKRLKKGPFDVPVEKSSSNSKQSKKSAARKRKNTQKGSNTSSVQAVKENVEDNFAEQTAETKDRIKKFKNGAGQNKKKEINKIIVKPEGRWYEIDDPDVSLTNQQSIKLPKEEYQKLYTSTSALYEKDVFVYKQACLHGNLKSDFQWMEKMMKVGTLPDRMAAFVVRIQDSPVHNIHHLQNLISMVKVQSKQQCLMAADTLKDLFLEDLLPPNRKLLSLEKRGINLNKGNEIQLVTWFFEDRLKICFSSYIAALKQMSLDTVEKIRAKAISLVYTLLTSHPEQEDVLLQMLVNKLGDTMKKVASRALFYLNSLLDTHPRMKLVVIDEVERLLFRNNIAKRAQYYGMCFLNSINLHNEHPEVACKLINVYVAFFKGCIKTGDIESKMMSALLTGVNKSYPLAKEYGYKFTENTDTLYKIAHLSNFNISIQALSILFQLTDVEIRPVDADRYYRVLYKELLRPEMATTSHSQQFLNLIFKSMKCDNRINRIMGFTKRLLQICQSVQPNLACAILFLLSEVAKVHPGIINCGVVHDESSVVDIADDEEEHKNDDTVINLMKISNVKVTNEESEKLPKNKRLFQLDTPEFSINDAQNDPSIASENESSSTTLHNDIKVEYKQEINDYDPNARNPCYCGAEFSLSHEIATLVQHYHPSVALFAEALLYKKPVTYEGNPLKDFTVSCFLERFVYRNAKKTKMTPGRRTVYQPKGLRSIAVNSLDYLNNSEDAIPVEEMFFYRYFKERAKDTKADPDDESETESIGDDEFDDLMANYFKTNKRKDDDDDMSDDLDFAANITSKKQSKKKKGSADKSDDSDSDADQPIENDDSGEDVFDDDFDADEMIDMDEDDDLDFEDEDGLEVFEEEVDVPKKKMKKLTRGLDMFAPAEQFAEILEANAEENISGPNQLISRDNADPKQLQWEVDRDRWAKGYKRNPKSKFKGKNKNSARHTKPKRK